MIAVLCTCIIIIPVACIHTQHLHYMHGFVQFVMHGYCIVDDTESQTDNTESQTDDTESQTNDIESQTDDTESQTDDTESQTDDTESQTDDTESQCQCHCLLPHKYTHTYVQYIMLKYSICL